MEHTIVDHALFLVLLVATPIWARWGFRRLRSRVEGGVPDARVSEYRNTLRIQWSFCVLLLFWWYISGRSWALLGFGHEPLAPLWIGLGLTVLALAFLAVQFAVVTGSEERLRELSQEFEDLRYLMPHDLREGQWFRAVSITAGICEEIAFRGFLMGYLQPWVGPWGALGLSSLAFGMGHLYQGPKGIVKTAVVGAIMGLLYLLSGSLWAPMLVHVLVDINAGELARRVIAREVQPVTG